MLLNYLKVAVRSLLRHRSYAVINIAGLSVALSCCILLLLYVQDELTYDGFHRYGDAIFRVTVTSAGGDRGGITQPPLAAVLRQEIPEVVRTVRLVGGSTFVRNGPLVHREPVMFVDPDFFRMFSFSLQAGDPASVLETPNGLVLTEQIAAKYFGAQDPLGKVLSLRGADRYQDFVVTGIVRPAPENSSITFDVLVPFETLREVRGEQFMTNWHNQAINTFVQLEGAGAARAVIDKLHTIVRKHIPDNTDGQTYGLQALADLHLNSSVMGRNGLTPASDRANSWILSAIAFFLLAIACINFINLAIGQSAVRRKEVGVRKVLGAHPRQLAWQFIGEGVLLAASALGAGIVLAELSLPAFSALAGKQLSLTGQADWSMAIAGVGLLLLVVLLAGGYPALFLSRFQPVAVLRKQQPLAKPGLLSRLLVVLQFALSVFLITGTFLLWTQVQFMKGKNLGFEKEQVVIIPTNSPDGTLLLNRFRAVLSGDPVFRSIAGSEFSLGSRGGLGRTPAVVAGRELTAWRFGVDYGFLESMNIPLVEGRYFSKDFPSDAATGVLVNETFVREFGLNNPLGTRFQYDTMRTIVGVVKDFHYLSLHERVEPLVLHMLHREPVQVMAVRVAGGDLSGALTEMREAWTRVAPDLPFEYSFLDDELDESYRQEERWAGIVGSASVLAVAVACFGLYGLVTHAVARRTKEIGIRKILGASVAHVVSLVCGDFLLLVAIANLVAWPAVYVMMVRLLENYAYRITIGPGSFLLAGFVSLSIAFATIGYRVYRAGTANPVDVLRYE